MTGIDATLNAAINAALAGPYHRIQALMLPDGRKVWLKQTERLSGWMRVQKGSGSTAFLREQAGLHSLAALGLPAASILAEGPDWFVTPDLGPTLRQLMWASPDMPADTLVPIFAAAGAALAQLHLVSYRHGRPAIRDFCWDGKAIHFIDLERFSNVKSDPRGLAIDLMIFVHSLMADGENVPKTAHILQEAAITAYRTRAPGIWAQARVTASWLRWLPTVARLRARSRDWRAMAPTLARFRTDPE